MDFVNTPYVFLFDLLMTVGEVTKISSSNMLDGDFEANKQYIQSGEEIEFFDALLEELLLKKPSDLVTFSLSFLKDFRQHEDKSVGIEYDDSMRSYLKEHEVHKFVDTWMSALMRERPALKTERDAFHENYLKGLEKH